MEIRPSERVREEIKSLYNRNPKKWHVLVGRDSRGYTSTIFLHRGRMWMIKEEPLNPYESIGCGLKVEIDESVKPFLEYPYSFGYRPVSAEHLMDLLKGGISGEAVGRVLRKAPVSTDRITSPAIVGPVTLPMRLDFVSEKQKKLDATLSRELDKLIQKKRPDLLLPYV